MLGVDIIRGVLAKSLHPATFMFLNSVKFELKLCSVEKILL